MVLSAYDEAMPGPPPDPALEARFADIRQLRPADPARLREVRELVLVVSASRGGSTMLAELLRGSPELVSLPGEVNPYVAVAQLGREHRRQVLAAEIAADLGQPPTGASAGGVDDGLEGLVAGCLWRLTAQWPELPLSLDHLASLVRRTVHTAGAHPMPAPAELTQRLLAELAAELRDRPGTVPPDWADLSAGQLLSRYDIPVEHPSPRDVEEMVPGPPSPRLTIEMPPYRLLAPWRPATDDELQARAVVLATPRNSYRIHFLAGLFPEARVRVLHLVRNPAASVNGLMDGWLHQGFFNCRMPVELDVAGYTDRFPAWARRWWKFDVPPGWEQVTRASLVDVCALQWRTAHEAVLSAVADERFDVHRVAYEDLVGPVDVREHTAKALGEWLGLRDVDRFVAAAAAGLPPLMATGAPGAGRWRARLEQLRPVLADDRVHELALRLGYSDDRDTWE